jgi:hypothetical protein
MLLYVAYKIVTNYGSYLFGIVRICAGPSGRAV